MNFTYCFKKWFQLISRPYNKYSHAIFFGSLVPDFLWGDLMPGPKAVNIMYSNLYTKDSTGRLVVSGIY
jgi:hypothetical protein